MGVVSAIIISVKWYSLHYSIGYNLIFVYINIKPHIKKPQCNKIIQLLITTVARVAVTVHSDLIQTLIIIHVLGALIKQV